MKYIRILQVLCERVKKKPNVRNNCKYELQTEENISKNKETRGKIKNSISEYFNKYITNQREGQSKTSKKLDTYEP
jgi:hypothetical protein